MRYEAVGYTLQEAVARSIREARVSYEVKENASISAGRGRYNRERVAVDLVRGRRYTISWATQNLADGQKIWVDIMSEHGNGSHREGGDGYGSWSFTAIYTGQETFVIGVSVAPPNLFSQPIVEFQID